MPKLIVSRTGKVYRVNPEGNLTLMAGPQATKIRDDLVAKTKAAQVLAEALNKDADEKVGEAGEAGEAPEWS